MKLFDKNQKKSPEINNLEDKIIKQKEEMDKSFVEIGKKYFMEFRDENNDMVEPICSAIDENIKTIKLCEKQILLLQGVKQCQNCKSHVSIDSVFCNKCGAKINDEGDEDGGDYESLIKESLPSIKCPDCGKENAGDTVFCTGCGAKIK